MKMIEWLNGLSNENPNKKKSYEIAAQKCGNCGVQLIEHEFDQDMNVKCPIIMEEIPPLDFNN